MHGFLTTCQIVRAVGTVFQPPHLPRAVVLMFRSLEYVPRPLWWMALPFCTLGPEGFAGFVLPIEPVSAGKASLLAQSVDVATRPSPKLRITDYADIEKQRERAAHRFNVSSWNNMLWRNGSRSISSPIRSYSASVRSGLCFVSFALLKFFPFLFLTAQPLSFHFLCAPDGIQSHFTPSPTIRCRVAYAAAR